MYGVGVEGSSGFVKRGDAKLLMSRCWHGAASYRYLLLQWVASAEQGLYKALYKKPFLIREENLEAKG